MSSNRTLLGRDRTLLGVELEHIPPSPASPPTPPEPPPAPSNAPPAPPTKPTSSSKCSTSTNCRRTPDGPAALRAPHHPKETRTVNNFSFTDVDEDDIRATVVERLTGPHGRPVLEVATNSETGVWMNADQAAAFATWLLEAVKALRARENA